MKALDAFIALVTVAFIFIVFLTDRFLLRPNMWRLSGHQCPPDQSVLNASMHKLMASTDPDELCPFPSPYLGKCQLWQRDL